MKTAYNKPFLIFKIETAESYLSAVNLIFNYSSKNALAH